MMNWKRRKRRKESFDCRNRGIKVLVENSVIKWYCVQCEANWWTVSRSMLDGRTDVFYCIIEILFRKSETYIYTILWIDCTREVNFFFFLIRWEWEKEKLISKCRHLCGPWPWLSLEMLGVQSAQTCKLASPERSWPWVTESGVKRKRRWVKDCERIDVLLNTSLIGSKELKANPGLICHFPNNILGWALDVLIPKTNLWVSLWGWPRRWDIFGQRLFWWALRKNNSVLLSFVSLTPCGGMG